MTKLTFALLTIFALTVTSFASKYTVDDEEIQLLWSVWKDAHGKNYTEAEEAYRLNVFIENYNNIIAHNNQKNRTVTLGLGRFADITGDEFKSQHAGGFDPTIQPAEDGEEQVEDQRFLASLPSSVDWRSKGAVTSVKNQLSCNGCWAFAAAAALEALHYIKTGSLENFSEQQLLDCDKTSNGCRSGHMSTVLDYTKQYGIELLSNYPYVDKAGSCKYSSSRATKVNKGRSSIRSNNANSLMTALVSQPVMVAIESAASVFQHYKSGVITSGCGASTDHAVLAVGYTTVNGIKSFIVKNSYGTAWGQKGYVYISAGSANGGAGVCGILSYPTIPTA